MPEEQSCDLWISKKTKLIINNIGLVISKY
jgi:hypothetical protein